MEHPAVGRADKAAIRDGPGTRLDVDSDSGVQGSREANGDWGRERLGN